MNKQKLLEEIQNFILNERGKYRFELQEHHSLQSDLGLYGMDAVEFILNFGNKFDVDVSSFEAERYFKPEGYDVPHAAARLHPPLPHDCIVCAWSNKVIHEK